MPPALSDPFRYPFGVPQHGFVISGGHIANREIPVLDGGSRSTSGLVDEFVHQQFGGSDVVGFMTCGSNAGPDRLAEKLRAGPVSDAVALRLRLADWVPTYAATTSYYGSIPSTFERCVGEIAEPFLVVMSADNLPSMIASEQRTANYDCFDVPASTLGLELSFPVVAFVCRYGAMQLGSSIQRLREFQANAARGVTQLDVINLVLEVISPGLTIEQFRNQMADPGMVADFRQAIRQRLSRSPNVSGWSIREVS